jgi:hypothetical protein
MSRTLGRTEWQEYICEDLQPVLRWLDERHNIHITEVVFDMKGIYTYIYVDGRLTNELAAEAGREFSAHAELRIGEGWFGCVRDFSSVEESKRDDQDAVAGKSMIERLKDLFG